MDLKLTEEQQMLRDSIRSFAEEVIKPAAKETDRTGKYPEENLKKCAELNLMGVYIPEALGGGGMDYLSYIFAVEELSRACATTGIIISAHTSLVCDPLLSFGTEEQKKKFLVPLAKGEKIGCFGLTEPEAGSDASNQQATAVKDGDHYVLNGTKVFITNAIRSSIFLVFAMTNKAAGTKGISTFIVEKGMPGFSLGKEEEKLGITASGTCELILEDVRVPKENLLGSEGMGFKIALQTLDGGRIGVAAQAVGITQAILDECKKYSNERKQFGKPISSFQAIAFSIADIATELEAAKLLTYKAAWLKQTGKRYSKEAAMAKLFASELAMKSAVKGIQIHGGYGYTKDYPMERFFRDAKVTEIYEGTSEIQRLVISANILA